VGVGTPFLRFRRGAEEKALERARGEASKAVVEHPRDILQYDMEVNNLIFMHLSKKAREEGGKLVERYGGVALGAKVALAAKLSGVKYVPAPNSYAWTLEAVEMVKGVSYLSYDDLVGVMLASQPWEAKAIAVYRESGFSKELSLKPVEDEPGDKLTEDLSWFESTSASGYLGGIKLLDKLTDGDKALLLSTMRFLDDSIKADEFKDPVVLGSTPEEHVYVAKELKERPIYDGYTRMHFDDPNLEKFDKAVNEELEKVAVERGLDKEGLLTVWKAVKDGVHAFIPAYYNFLGLDPETYVPKAVAKAVADTYKLYGKVQGLREGLKAFDPKGLEQTKLIAEALNTSEEVASEVLVRLVDRLAGEDLREFAEERLPYVIYRIGANLGTAFNLEKVYEYTGDERPYVELSKFLLSLGIVTPPQNLKDVINALRPRAKFADVFLAKRVRDTSEQTFSSVYAAFYGMGVPATRFFVPAVRDRAALSSDRFYSYSATFMTTANIKQFINEELLDEGVKDPITGLDISVGKAFFRVVNDAITKYIKNITEHFNAEELRPDNPMVYRGMLYIYSDRDFTLGYSKSIWKDRSPHTALLKSFQNLILNVELGKFLMKEHLPEISKLVEKGKASNSKVAEYVGKMRKVEDTIKAIEAEMGKLAKTYNPKYIEYLSYTSNNIYEQAMKKINEKSEGKTGRTPAILTTSASLAHAKEMFASTSNSILEAVANTQNYNAFLEYLKKKKEEEKKKKEEERRKEEEEYLTRTVESLGYFLEYVERERRRDEETAKQTQQTQEQTQTEAG